MQPQRLMVPLFQRPYVWNLENQWEPLWRDITRVAESVLASPAKHQPHFLGAVVLQQVQNPVGPMQQRTIIDGQQRLTTLQLLLDALHAELRRAGATQPAMRIDALVSNAGRSASTGGPVQGVAHQPGSSRLQLCDGGEPPVEYDALGHAGERLVQAHRFFRDQARDWLYLNGAEDVAGTRDSIEHRARPAPDGRDRADGGRKRAGDL